MRRTPCGRARPRFLRRDRGSDPFRRPSARKHRVGRRDDRLGETPGEAKFGRVAAAGLPAAFGGTAAAWSVLAGEAVRRTRGVTPRGEPTRTWNHPESEGDERDRHRPRAPRDDTAAERGPSRASGMMASSGGHEEQEHMTHRALRQTMRWTSVVLRDRGASVRGSIGRRPRLRSQELAPGGRRATT